MNELSRHIEVLLLEHDCVIIPQLGGFVAQYVSAHRVTEEQTIYPPFRTVGFNAQLTLNDGLLVQSYMQAYDTSYPETLRMIEDEVNHLKETLQNKGSFEFRGIGILSLNLDGTYHFTPNESGVLSPELYGLGAFSLPYVEGENSSPEPVEPTASSPETVSERSKHYTLSLNKELCNYVAAAVVALLFYFLWSTPADVVSGGSTSGSVATIAAVPFVSPVSNSTKHSVESPNAVSKATGTIQNKTADGKNDNRISPIKQNVNVHTDAGGFVLVLASS